MFLEKSRDRIIQEFDKFCQTLPGPSKKIQKDLLSLDEDTALALKFLYVNMPYSDVGNYSLETYLDYALQGVYLWKNSPYRADIPESIFLNDILYHRVNEEEIKPCRRLFWEKIAGHIAGMDMESAILEVNYWCAREMTYQCTDDRTSSAYDCYLKGYGRCGEESVFAVNALRSVGLPARQVYAPKWSHCDDNHAWVEVWCDGEWHYFGACEPEPVLNKGWFTNAASRAMMVHSRCFEMSGSREKVVGTDGINMMKNQLHRYGKTKNVTIRVEDLDGCPVEGAQILAEVLNYSEFSPVAKLVTGADGSAELETGLGSLHIFASFGGEYGECVIDTREEDGCCCVLGEEKPEDVWVDFDMIAPADTASGKYRITEEQEERNSRRIREAAAIRKEKTEHFRPRWKDAFLCGQPELAEEYMSVLSEKDRTDADPEVLQEHYEESLIYAGDYSREIFLSYVWNPRVADEVLTKWRHCILEYFSSEKKEEFRKDPKEIWNWIQSRFVSRPERERLTVYTVPAAALRLGIAEKNSRKVLFVAIARTLGIPARLNPTDTTLEYWENGGFVRVLKEREKDAHLTLCEEAGTKWSYFMNWSVAKLKEDGYHSLKLRDTGWKNGRLELDVEPGEYRILTSNRLPTGNIFAKRYDFQIRKGERKEISLEMREACLADMLDRHSIPDHDLTDKGGAVHSIGSLTGNGRKILFWLEVSKEPTEHILNELMEMQEEYGQCQDQLLFIIRRPEDLSDPTLSRCRNILPDVKIFYDTFGKDLEMTARRMYVDPDKLPLLVVTDGPAEGIFAASGYSVGMADMLMRVLKN
ncbi:MAG: transglutaminase-like domain-containing protein [Eubacteriales bacterium]|nr:transglutaminase-like domain-containing protein [Eubacteriales bacterium]